ncbi:hypothetical protein D915_000321 [Fasciola hepatica]|uniref:Uncharacterized protein n=1 Tax=Fasciola hepatica TaxID=6192 RepID=A0A4E0RIT2_FASHE|nr:hypothetical protein D915_000321 [Fasciola hepatica]
MDKETRTGVHPSDHRIPGVIFDDQYAFLGPEIGQNLSKLKARLMHAVYVSLPPKYQNDVMPIRFETTKFSYHAACDLLAKGVHMIISVSSCTVAQMITSIIRQYSVPYVAILRDGCTLSDSGQNHSPFRLSVGPSARFIAKAINQLLRMQRVRKALVLSGGQSFTGILVMNQTSQVFRSNNDALLFSAQQYRLSHPGLNVRVNVPTLQTVLQFWQDQLGQSAHTYKLTHVIPFSPDGVYLEELKTIFNSSLISNRLFWILGSLPNVAPKHYLKLINGATTLPKGAFLTGINVAFFRTFPILDHLDCIWNPKSDTVRIFAAIVYECKIGGVSEPFLLITFVAFLASREATQIVVDERPHWTVMRTICGQLPPERAVNTRTRLLDMIRSDLNSTHINDVLWFYATESDYDRRRQSFATTVMFPLGGRPIHTVHGNKLLEMNGRFDAFPNRFTWFNNQELRVGVMTDGIFVEQFTRIGNELFNVSGMAIDFLDEMSKQFNFTYRFFVPEDGQYGALLGDGNWTGLFGDLLNQRIDLAMALLTITEDRSKAVQFLGPFMQTTLATMISQPKLGIRIFQIYKPLNIMIWLYTGCCIFAVALSASMFNRLSPYSAWNGRRADATTDELSVAENVWITFRSIAQQPLVTFPVANSTRILILMFWFFVLIWHACWQAQMTAFFSTRELVLPVQTVRDIAQQNTVRPIVLNGSSVYMRFKSARKDPVYRRIYEMLQEDKFPIYTYSDATTAMLNHPNLAFIDDQYLLLTVVTAHCEHFYLLDELFDETPASFAVRKSSEYAEEFTDYFEALRASAIINQLFDKWKTRQNVCTSDGFRYESLGLDISAGGVLPLACGSALAIVALAMELFWLRFGDKVKGLLFSVLFSDKRKFKIFNEKR